MASKLETPASKIELKFATAFVTYRDVYKAAEKAKVPKNGAVRMFNLPRVQDEIERQNEAIRAERAKQAVQAEKLDGPLIDRELLSVVKLDPVLHGTVKLAAIRLAMVAQGRIQDGNTKSLDPSEQGGGHANVYRALVSIEQPEDLMPVASQKPASTGEELIKTYGAVAVGAAIAADIKAGRQSTAATIASGASAEVSAKRAGAVKIG
jgi:hypothetical protein